MAKDANRASIGSTHMLSRHTQTQTGILRKATTRNHQRPESLPRARHRTTKAHNHQPISGSAPLRAVWLFARLPMLNAPVEGHEDGGRGLVDGAHERLARAADVGHHLAHQVGAIRVQARGGFVQEQDAGISGQLHPHGHPLALLHRGPPNLIAQQNCAAQRAAFLMFLIAWRDVEFDMEGRGQ